MVAIVDELEHRSLTERRRNPDDRRAYALRPRSNGRIILTKTRRLAHDNDEPFCSPLPPTERAQLLADASMPSSAKSGENLVSFSGRSAHSHCMTTTHTHERPSSAGDRSQRAIDPVLLTITEAATALAIGRTTVYELIGAGELDVVHIGRSSRIPADAIHEFVAAKRAHG